MTNKEKTLIGGIKFSEERVHYTITRPHSTQATINDLLQHIHSKQVNIPFYSHSVHIDLERACFCVSQKDAASISEIIEISNNSNIKIVTHTEVGSVTIFPHKKDLALIAVIMSLMESLHLPVYSSCTSISAYIFNTQITELQTLTEQLTDIFALPENHSPFHQQFQLRQPRSVTAP